MEICLNDLLLAMQNSEDCLGFKEHKVLTTNLIFNCPIEGEDLSPTMKRLKAFAEECYRNGWLQSISMIQDKIKQEEQ